MIRPGSRLRRSFPGMDIDPDDLRPGQACGMNNLDFHLENDPLEKSLHGAVYRGIAVLRPVFDGQTVVSRASYATRVWGDWARLDSNQGPRDYESPALTAVLRAPAAGF